MPYDETTEPTYLPIIKRNIKYNKKTFVIFVATGGGNKLLQPKGSLRRGISTSDQNLNRRSFRKKTGSGNAEAHLVIQDVSLLMKKWANLGLFFFNFVFSTNSQQ